MSPRPRVRIGEQIAIQNEKIRKNLTSFLRDRTTEFPNLKSEFACHLDKGELILRIKAKSPLVKLSDIDAEELADFKRTLDIEVNAFNNQELTDWTYSKGLTGFNPYWYKQYQFIS